MLNYDDLQLSFIQNIKDSILPWKVKQPLSHPEISEVIYKKCPKSYGCPRKTACVKQESCIIQRQMLNQKWNELIRGIRLHVHEKTNF